MSLGLHCLFCQAITTPSKALRENAWSGFRGRYSHHTRVHKSNRRFDQFREPFSTSVYNSVAQSAGVHEKGDALCIAIYMYISLLKL